MTHEPLNFEGRWLWHNADHPLADRGDYPDHLPGGVHGRLAGYIPEPADVTALVKAYPTREAALEALSDALAPEGTTRDA